MLRKWYSVELNKDKADLFNNYLKTNNIKFEAIGSDFVIESTKEKYSVGKLQGSVYTNEWANLCIEVDERFTQAPQEQYDVYDNILSDCGAYFIVEDDGDELGIVFYKGSGYSVKEYCDEALDTWMGSVRTHVNDKAEFYNYWYKEDAGYFNDYNENFVVFLVE